MSWLLRHSGRFDNRSWLPIPQVLDFLRVSRDQLEEILRRMRVSDEWIRACQGHSVQVDTSDLLEEISMAAAPSALWHASFRRHRQSIAATGLRRGNRQHVHLGPASSRTPAGRSLDLRGRQSRPSRETRLVALAEQRLPHGGCPSDIINPKP